MHIRIWESTAITKPPDYDRYDPCYIKINHGGAEYVIRAISDGITVSVGGQMVVVPRTSNMVSLKEKEEHSE
jgi:hypothetical protein